MSCYCRAKVLRLPIVDEQLDLGEDRQWDFEETFPDLVAWFEPGKFMVTGVQNSFLDYVIDYNWDCCDGDWGKTRELYQSEKIRFEPVFQQIIQDVNMDDVKVVEFSWYNGVDAPDYYDDMEDEFYKEIL